MNEQIVQTLSSLNLTKTEISTYLTILSNPDLTISKISKLAQSYRPNIYQAIEKLKSKGLISEEITKKTKTYKAFSPDRILEQFKEKESDVQKAVSLLKEIENKSSINSQIRIIEGTKGWKNLLEEFLETKKERIVFGIPKNALELEGFFKEYHKKRAKQKIPLRHLFNYEAKDRIKITNKLPHTKSKYLPRELSQTVSTSICGNLVALTVYEKYSALTLVIENESIARAYKKYFEFLWRLAKA